jgi:EAL domain-containing protein (putative c-di-GMP-specific phosphodiesterase class I)
MQRMDTSKNPVKQAGAWVTEKASRVGGKQDGAQALQTQSTSSESSSLDSDAHRDPSAAVVRCTRSYYSDIMSTEAEVLAGAAGMLDEILKGAELRSVFQPIVDLETGRLFGYEALTRGPGGSMLEQPDPLFAVARAEGRLAELDAACQATAVASAERHAIGSPLTLFVNAEPERAGFGVLPRLGRDVRGIIELTERTLTSRLADLLPAVQAAREQGWGIALDDVGADTRSLALMPLLRPDVIKLDLRLVQDQPTPEIAAIAGAVGAQAERTGATVLAEGIETEEQAQYARALGATLGQGFLFGHPSPEPARRRATDIPLPIYSVSLPYTWRTPFELASAHSTVRRGTIGLLAAISRELERQAATSSRTSLLISSFPGVDHWMSQMNEVYRELSDELAFAAVLGVGIPPEPSPGLKGVSIHEDDPVSGTWNVIVISAHFASMLAAKERPRAGSPEQEFDFIFTYDRNVIVECAQALMLRLAHLPTPNAKP